jgi:flagellin-like hook-associated protein FlgL
MSNNITLTSSMRSNLASLKTIATQLDETQLRLSSGKKVNSAIDNASNYYQARALTNRVADLNNLLDSIGQGIQTIEAATTGLKTLTNYLDQISDCRANNSRSR